MTNPRLTFARAVGVSTLFALVACGGGAVMSGVAVGRVGRGLSTNAENVPRGAEVCALQDALATPSPTEKPTSETCEKATRSDELWRRAMVVLAAHSDRLEALASGTKPENAGPLEAALTGVRGNDWIQVDDPQEQAAKDAVTQLVDQMSASDSKADLGKAVTDAAPRVKTICEGLTAYLDKQVAAVGDVEKEVEKRRAAHANPRCGKVGDQGVCVGDSYIDRLVFSDAYGRAVALASSHTHARDAVTAFCAAHQKLEGAVAAGQLKSDQTYADIVAAVKGASSAAPSSGKPATNSEKK